jgi:hypothetical protein
MHCLICNHNMSKCTCADREERLRTSSDNPYVAIKWCPTCDKSYHSCKCEAPTFMMRRNGQLEPLPGGYDPHAR